MVRESESSTEDKEPPNIDCFSEAFPNFDINSITQGAPTTTAETCVQRDATQSGYQPPTEEQIQAAIRRANLAFNNPLTNVPRRGPPGAGRARNRSAEVSFNLPFRNPGPRLEPQPPSALPQAPTTSSLPPLASGSTRGRGISVHGRAAYIPTLPAANRTSQLIRPRATNFSRPIVVGGFDNPYHDHLQRVARREIEDRRTLESYSSPPRRAAQRSRPLPELPPGNTPLPVVAPNSALQAPLPAQPADPPHPLRSNPVASSHQDSTLTLPRRRPRSSSVSIPPTAAPADFRRTIDNHPIPETIPEEAPIEDDDFEYSEDPEIHTAQIGRIVRPHNDPTTDDSSDIRLRGGSLEIEDFPEEFDPSYYESDDLEDDLVELNDEFNPNISEDFNPHEIEAQSQVYKQVLNKMASHIPRPGPAQLSPNAGLDEWLEEAKQCHYLPERAMKELCELVKEVLMEESNIQPVCTPVTVCGDIHGQFYDLLELFRVAGGMPGESRVEAPKTATTVISPEDIEPPTEITNPKLKKKVKNAGSPAADDEEDDEAAAADSSAMSRPDSAVEVSATSQSADTRFVFLGDFVDRGYFSLETFTLLMCLKAKYPDRIVLVRGNHESRQITQVYGFYEECQQKYGNASVWKACCHVFDFLVLAAIVDGELLCVHGGLSPEIRTIDQIRVVARAQEIPHEGAFCDLVWSDPEDVETWAISPRGAGWLFGDKVATEFNHVNGLKLIARAHQLVNEGYKYHFPQNSVVTVWSAPNYCYRCGNVASIMTVDKDMNPKFSIFSAVPDDQRHVPANRRGPGDYFL
ncbi:protein phosphatase 2a [Colletotrichum truncatum]|uniref:Protein phosphatase 2a n=1 Tax=Colletotrichum truncatum TaxID=5467 RepID=A0ACC3ZAI2_COLTU|nr:protein phosphatase 2a [Colletotrichum truncatum]KAF6796275.1 protein phosphatase 2a [Colletotrichum truncatum]